MIKETAREGYLTKSELGKFFSISARTIDRWLANGCPKIRIGGNGIGKSARFRLADVEAWLEARERVESR